MPDENEDSFALPNDLGWACNDEVSLLMDEWMNETAKVLPTSDGKIDMAMWQVAKAQLMDRVYLIIRRYQELKDAR